VTCFISAGVAVRGEVTSFLQTVAEPSSFLVTGALAFFFVSSEGD
jgi:hypothetical protein